MPANVALAQILMRSGLFNKFVNLSWNIKYICRKISSGKLSTYSLQNRQSTIVQNFSTALSSNSS